MVTTWILVRRVALSQTCALQRDYIRAEEMSAVRV